MNEPVLSGGIRDLLKHLIGQRLMEITEEDDDEEGDPFVDLLFENAQSVRFFIAPNDAYECGAPLCFSDPNGDSDGLYHPDPEDVAAHKWAVVVEITPKGEMQHIIPCFGKLHAISEICDCGPKKELKDGHEFYNHKEME